MEHLLSRRAAGATSSVIRDLLRLVDRPGVLSLAGGLPAPEGFPVERIRLAAERALAGGGRYGVTALQYGPTEGDDELRGLAAARLGAPADEVLITTGSQQGLDLVARAPRRSGRRGRGRGAQLLGRSAGASSERAGVRRGGTDECGLRTDLLERPAGGRIATEAALHGAQLPEPVGGDAAARAPAPSRRAGRPVRLPDRRGRSVRRPALPW